MHLYTCTLLTTSIFTSLLVKPSFSIKIFAAFFVVVVFVSMFIALLVRIGLEKAMAPHSSTLAWKIPWMEEPGRCNPWGR